MRRSQIAPGVHLSYDAAQKFNRCRISIHFAFPARRETATAHALLPLVMERGYADCPDMTQMTKKLARLYGADLTVDARPMGCSHNLCVSITGIKDQFALEGEKLTQEYAALALGTAFHPYFVGSTFDPEAVGIEKQMLKKALEDEVNDKRLYCQRQANREFFGDSPAGVRQEGYLEEVDGLTPEALTEAYYEMLRTANIELIVLGCDEASTTAVWTLNRDGIVASGQRFGLERLGLLANALALQKTRHVLIVLRPDVPVQSVATVLELLSAQGITSVQIAETATTAPGSTAPVTTAPVSGGATP